MLDRLPPRERQIVTLLYERGSATVVDICEGLPDPLSGSAVRAMLSRLEEKGFVSRRASDRGFLYAPAVPEARASRSALAQVVKTFFHGSPAGAATALLGMSERLEEQDLEELERLIARARQEQRQ